MPEVLIAGCVAEAIFDFQKKSKNEPFAPYNGSHPMMAKLACFFRDNGLFTFTGGTTSPATRRSPSPRRSLRKDLRSSLIARGLELTDAVFEG